MFTSPGFQVICIKSRRGFLKTSLLSHFPIPGVTHLEIVEAGLQVLENDVIGPVTIESIRLMKNQISSIEEDAFR